MNRTPDDIAKSLEDAGKSRDLPPLDKWHPELSGNMDLVITRDGQWVFKGEPIAREATVKLFSTILRRESDGEYYLVTPVEKWRIRVEDAPLLAHGLEVKGEGAEQVITLATNMGETPWICRRTCRRMDFSKYDRQSKGVIVWQKQLQLMNRLRQVSVWLLVLSYSRLRSWLPLRLRAWF